MDSLVEEAVDSVDEESEAIETAESRPNEPQKSIGGQQTQTTESDSFGSSQDELMDIVQDLQTEITVVGCGGAGSNTITRMNAEGITGADLIAVNTDAQHLATETQADNRMLIGREKCQGRGAGSNPQKGEEAALENQAEIESAVSDSDMVFVTAGMGGGTGTGAAPIVAQAAQNAGALTISIVTLPFTSEGEARRTNAEGGLARLREVSDTVIVVPNDKLLDVVGNMPIHKAFKVADEVLMRSVKGITELITNPGMVNLDFADVTTIMEDGGVAMIGLGESDSEQKARDSVRSALSSPLLDVDISSADSVLVNVTGGNDMAIEEAEGVVDQIHNKVDQDARIIWGTSVDDELEGSLRTMLVVTGVESPQMYGSTSSSKAQTTQESPSEPNQSPQSTGGASSQTGQSETADEDDEYSGIDYVS